ncbi:hypothetical protein [Streptomyces sp. UH6]|uniref:hypothetical protein n=1 Tax=Streptomyces sp. UH6 TaxID=2748379 RepID=UPI0015D49BD7|nr:hypothetical protein [Streptomyces sp. UH6]NYV77807.1 hypothetical protein [Streptomyces sp. UH6]
MHEQQSEHRTGSGGPEAYGRRRRASVVAFVAGVVAGLGFFLFFPGLPHVIDWGAILVALALGVVARAGCLAWLARRGADRPRR